eukprot:COSAG01_NODE_2790_length_7072_cov_665.915818_4_plen_86_part_00
MGSTHSSTTNMPNTTGRENLTLADLDRMHKMMTQQKITEAEYQEAKEFVLFLGSGEKKDDNEKLGTLATGVAIGFALAHACARKG